MTSVPRSRGGHGPRRRFRTAPHFCRAARTTRFQLRRRHRRGRTAVSTQQRSLRRQISPRNFRLRLRIPRFRQRRLARHPARQRHGLARPQAPEIHAEAVSQQSQRHLHRRHRARGPRYRDVRHGRGRRRLQQRRLPRHLHHLRRPEPSLPQQRRRTIYRCHRRPQGSAAARASALPHCGSITTATACSICSSATTCSWSPEHDVFCSLDGTHKSYCTPEAYHGDTCWLFRNRGDGTFEDVTATSGIFDTHLEISRRGHVRLRSATAGPTSSSPTTRSPTSSTAIGATERSRTSPCEAGVAFSEDGKARAGMGVDTGDFDNSGAPGHRHHEFR